MKNLDLDVDSPEKVVGVLRKAADAYYESAVELEAAWQDKSASRPWSKIAQELEKVAAKIEKFLYLINLNRKGN